MAKVVNLRRARKERALGKKREEAGGNAARFGRTKAERLRDEQEKARAENHLDGHQRTDET